VNLKFLRSVFLQFSAIVGAGIFTLPYLFYQSNFYFAVIGLIIISLITAIINLFYIDIVNSTPGQHQLPGYAEIYLGRRSKFLAAFNLLLICIGSIFAYNKLATDFFLVFFPAFNFRLVSIFFIFLVLALYPISKKHLSSFFDFLPIVVIFLSLIFLSLVFNFPLPSLDLMPPGLIFVGATIFAISGFTVIPEIPKKYLLRASLAGLFLATLLYIVYSYSIIKLSGPFLSTDSISGILRSSPVLAYILSVFGILITFKGSLNMLTVFHQIFHQDFNLKPRTATLLTFLISLLTIILLKLTLIEAISLLGSITVSLSILIICFIRLKLPHSFSIKFGVYFVIAVFISILLVTLFF